MLKATTGLNTVYYTRGFELISRREGYTASYYIYDGGLSVRALTDETGAVTDTLVFDAFGNATEKTGTTENPYGLQGEEKDATGLYYLRARYMDPSTGTFTTMDTYVGSLSDPMSLHKYLFANSNPVLYSDPSGHEIVLNDQMVACGIMGMICSATLFWIDLAIHPEKDFSDGDYIKALVGGFVAGVIAWYLGAEFAGAAFTLSWHALFCMGGILFCGLLGYWVNAAGKYISDVSEKNHIFSGYLLGFLLECIGDGMMGPMKTVMSLNNDFIGFVLDLFGIIVEG